MIDSMTSQQFDEWQWFATLEPFGPERWDMNFASIVQALWHIASKEAQKHDLSDFVLRFGDTPVPKRPEQTVEYQEQLIDAWVYVNNAQVAAKEARHR